MSEFVQYGVLGVSVVVNVVLAVYVIYKGQGVSAAEVLSEFKAAVMKVKAAKDKASVDSVALTAGITQILEVLQPKV